MNPEHHTSVAPATRRADSTPVTAEPGESPATGATPATGASRTAGPHGTERNQLGVVSGLAALSLDALASVAYGPEAIVLVLAVAGGQGLGFTLPVTIAIAVLLFVLTLSYRQVIAAFPQGGGAYGVAKTYLGKNTSLVAAASLVLDYVLNVAVSVAAGVAALTSAFPELLPYTVPVCLGVLAVVTAINFRGVAGSARAFIVPTIIYVLGLLAVVIVGLVRTSPAEAVAVAASDGSLQTVGVLLLLKAFANGCSALTGVEAIANAVPAFRAPAVRRAQRAELALAVVLGTLLIGIALLIEKFGIVPVDGVTILSQVTAASLGSGILFYVVQFATMILLALAANTSFGGLPVLLRLLANDNFLPHVFSLRADRQVHRYGIGVLAVLSAILLTAAGGQMNTLVPLFAIGVFVGFTIAQTGLVIHWRRVRTPGWRGRLALNAFGAVLTGVAAVVIIATKITEGAWLIAIALPLLVLGFRWVNRRYRMIGAQLALGAIPDRPAVDGSRHASTRPGGQASANRPSTQCVIVPVGVVSRLTAETLATALSIRGETTAVHVCGVDEPERAERLQADWNAWNPGVPLVMLPADPHERLADPLVAYVREHGGSRPFVVIGEVEPEHAWQRFLQNQRGAVLARALRAHTDAVTCRVRFRIHDEVPTGSASETPVDASTGESSGAPTEGIAGARPAVADTMKL